MKFYVGSKETGYHFKYEVERRYDKNGKFVSLAEVKNLFRETPDENDSQYGWDNDSNLVKKMRVRQCKDGWFLYLPEPNAKICFNKNDTKFEEDSYKQKNYDFPLPNIDVTVFPTDDFEKLIDVMDKSCGRLIERLMHFEADVYTGFEKLGEVIGGHYGYFYRPCIVKAKKSGRKEERQDRNAKFHRWADLSKGVQQVVAIVEFDDGHIEQVQPDRVVFKEEE